MSQEPSIKIGKFFGQQISLLPLSSVFSAPLRLNKLIIFEPQRHRGRREKIMTQLDKFISHFS
jgi:hypothetical protein